MSSPSSLSKHPKARISRRAFLATASAAAAAATLGPFPSRQMCHSGRNLAIPRIRNAYANSQRGTTIERVLGATRCALDELRAHEHDTYYLSTSFGNTGPNGAGGAIGTWDCWYPNGRPKANGQAYMNCAGFVVAVLEACGANCDSIGSYVGSAGYNRGNKSNLYRWIMYLNDHAELRTRFESKDALLASGALQKGDLIIADPRDWSVPGVDCHILFFWGDSPSHDLAWHSSNHADGVIAGTCPGNMISKISAKSSDVYWLHVPLQNVVKLALEKSSASLSIADGTEGAPFYSLENARFSVFETCVDGQCSGLITQFTTDAHGHAEIELAPDTDVWIREDAAPLGFCAWSAPISLHVPANESREALRDEPQTIRVEVEKSDAEHPDAPQGHAQLDGAAFELVDSKGDSHRALTEKAEGGQWVATFPEVARGRLKLREARAPIGYKLTPLQGADAQGWIEINASPNQAIRCQAIRMQASDYVMRGDIEGVKIFEAEHGESSTTRPALEGAVFRIWLQDDGSLASKGYNVEPIVTASGDVLRASDGSPLKGARMGDVASGKDGRFTSKDLLDDWNPEQHNGQPRPECALPFGTYAVVEMSCPDPALRLAQPLTDIELHADGQIVFLAIEDRRIYSPVRIRKCDANSGKSVLAPGTTIELLRKDDTGAYLIVEFTLHTPEDIRISRFSIPESGIVQFPEKLAWGSYAIREVSTVAPYVVREQLVEFDVGKNHDWNESDIIEIDLPNEQATGAIEGLKIDEETGLGVEGAAYTVIAAHDIVSPDGTMHLKAGELAGSARSDSEGAWRVEGLPLGMGEAEYLVVEAESPDGFISETKEHRIVLTWENDRQTVFISSIEINEKPTRALLKKTDARTGMPIEGVAFELSAQNAAEEENEPNTPDEPNSTQASTSEAHRVPEPIILTSDAEGIAQASHLPRDFEYVLEEIFPRDDLGYVTYRERVSRYLAPDGRWYDNRHAYDKAKECEQPGDEAWKVTIENECTSLKFFKVDAKAYREAKYADDEPGSAERAAARTHLTGGLFRLEDEDGNPIAPKNTDLDARGWPAQGADPVEFDHLQPGRTYWMVEICAPDGYTAEEQKVEVHIPDSAEPIVVVLGNDKNETMAKTLDNAPQLFTSAAAVAIASGIAAMAAYTRRRAEIAGGSRDIDAL